MRAYELFEGKWWEFDKPITLYHGTSDQLLDKISKEGLNPPINGVVEYALEVLDDYDKSDDEEIKELIIQKVHGFRGFKDIKGQEREKVLYFHLDLDRARTYAEAYAEHGGEIAYEVFSILKIYRAISEPRWKKAKPIIIEVVIPRDWILTYMNKSLQKLYNDLMAKGYNTSKTLEHVEKTLELRVEQNIPPNMITRIIKV